MKKLIIIAVIAICGYLAYQKYTEKLPVYTGAPYIHVYGRTSCGYTRQMMQYLQTQGTPFSFYSVDNAGTADILHTNMRAAGLNTRSYYLPVVDVNGKISIRPDPKTVSADYYR
jgi:hypothetical protein